MKRSVSFPSDHWQVDPLHRDFLANWPWFIRGLVYRSYGRQSDTSHSWKFCHVEIWFKYIASRSYTRVLVLSWSSSHAGSRGSRAQGVGRQQVGRYCNLVGVGRKLVTEDSSWFGMLGPEFHASDLMNDMRALRARKSVVVRSQATLITNSTNLTRMLIGTYHHCKWLGHAAKVSRLFTSWRNPELYKNM